MAASQLFTAASSQYLQISSTCGITSFPFTLVINYAPNSIVTDSNILTITDNTVLNIAYGIRQYSTGGYYEMFGRNGIFRPSGGTIAPVLYKWVNLCAVFRGDNDREFYVNGISDATDATAATFAGTSNVTTIGALDRSSGITGPTDGYISDAMIFNRALGINEIQELVYNPTSIANGLNLNLGLRENASAYGDYKDLTGNYTVASGTIPAASSLGPPVFFS